MARSTSIQAYQAMLQSGLLGARQKQAYAVLFHFGPLTGNELSARMKMPGQWKRCSELKKRGLVTEVGERNCSITGINCITWDVTSNVPQKPFTRIGKPEQIDKVRQLLRDIYWRLKNNVPVPLDWLETEAKYVIEVLENGTDPRA